MHIKGFDNEWCGSFNNREEFKIVLVSEYLVVENFDHTYN